MRDEPAPANLKHLRKLRKAIFIVSVASFLTPFALAKAFNLFTTLVLYMSGRQHPGMNLGMRWPIAFFAAESAGALVLGGWILGVFRAVRGVAVGRIAKVVLILAGLWMILWIAALGAIWVRIVVL